MDLLVAEGTVVTLDERRTVQTASVAVGGGRVLGIGPASTLVGRFGPPAQRVDAGGRYVFPGLINAHTHLYQTFHRGLGDGLPFARWQREAIGPGYAAMGPEEVYAFSLLGAVENLLSGATTAVSFQARPSDFESCQATLRACADAGLRCVLVKGVAAPEDLADAARLCRERPGQVALGPPIPGRVGDEVWTALVRLAREHGVGIHTHLAEQRDEAGQVERLDALGALGPHFTGAHGVWLAPRELAVLRERGASLVHCPASNLYLGSGLARLDEWLRQGVGAALGTDGPASNNNQDMLATLKLASLLAKGLAEDPGRAPPGVVLELATLGGARSIGRPDLGRIEPGCPADLVVVDFRTAFTTPVHRPVSQLVYAATPASVHTVVVGGRVVLSEGRPTRVNEPEVLAAADRAGRDVARRAGLDALEGGNVALDLRFRDARLPDGSRGEVVVRAGRIVADGPTGGEEVVDCHGRLLAPAFVEPHIHLDKAHILDDLPPPQSGTLSEAIELTWQRKRRYTVEDVAARAVRVIGDAITAGVTRLRTHVDVDPVGGLVPLEGVLEARRRYADRIDIQIVAFPQEGIFRAPGTEELLRRAMERGADLVGGMPANEATPEDSLRHVRFVFDLAAEHDADVDLHVDETDDPFYRTLEMVADETLRRGWEGRVTAGHACALAAYDDHYAAYVMDKVAAAGMHVITNPVTNLMLQGRGDGYPKRRGLTRVKELLARGVNVSFGQDNVRDAFYPLGRADRLEVAFVLCHAAQFARPEEIRQAFAMCGETAARVLRLGGEYGLAPGARADLVLLDCEDVADAIRLQPPRLGVWRAGRRVAGP